MMSNVWQTTAPQRRRRSQGKMVVMDCSFSEAGDAPTLLYFITANGYS